MGLRAAFPLGGGEAVAAAPLFFRGAYTPKFLFRNASYRAGA
jgi:hypothetical protein